FGFSTVLEHDLCFGNFDHARLTQHAAKRNHGAVDDRNLASAGNKDALQPRAGELLLRERGSGWRSQRAWWLRGVGQRLRLRTSHRPRHRKQVSPWISHTTSHARFRLRV